MSEIATGAFSGAASGAAAGSVAGPWGAVIGGVIGLVGGIFGGSKAKKAKKYAKKAAAVQQEREENALYNSYLQYIREARISRAQSVQAAANANVESSSLLAGAVSSMGSQMAYTTRYTAEDYRLASLYNYYMQKAGKSSAQSSNIMSVTSALTGVIGAVGSLFGGEGGTKENPLTTTEGSLSIALAEAPQGAQGIAYGTFTPNPGVLQLR